VTRRPFLRAAAVALACASRTLRAQPAAPPRIGFLYYGSRQSAQETGRYESFVQGMRELGYAEGRTVVIDAKFADGSVDRLGALVAELASARASVIVATGTPVYQALRRADNAIPVVVTVTADPVLGGIAATIARPGGLFTGLTDGAVELGPKQLELLGSLAPGLKKLGVLVNPGNPAHAAQAARLVQAAQEAGVKVALAEAGKPADVDAAIASLASQRVQGVLILGDTFFAQQYAQIAKGPLRHRLPSVGLARDYPKAGGLMSYGPDIADNFRRAAVYVDRILKGAKPAELPFEHPTRYRFVVNLATARALGLAPPPQLLLRADEVLL